MLIAGWGCPAPSNRWRQRASRQRPVPCLLLHAAAVRRDPAARRPPPALLPPLSNCIPSMQINLLYSFTKMEFDVLISGAREEAGGWGHPRH